MRIFNCVEKFSCCLAFSFVSLSLLRDDLFQTFKNQIQNSQFQHVFYNIHIFILLTEASLKRRDTNTAEGGGFALAAEPGGVGGAGLLGACRNFKNRAF
jgi:hypothetical protein